MTLMMTGSDDFCHNPFEIHDDYKFKTDATLMMQLIVHFSSPEGNNTNDNNTDNTTTDPNSALAVPGSGAGSVEIEAINSDNAPAAAAPPPPAAPAAADPLDAGIAESQSSVTMQSLPPDTSEESIPPSALASSTTAPEPMEEATEEATEEAPAADDTEDWNSV